MHLGLIGLGKMGKNMRTRMRNAGLEVTGYDRNPDVSDVESVDALIQALPTPRTVWVMVPAGEITKSVVMELAQKLEAGDTVIDGGNSRYTDDAVHSDLLGEKEIGYLDCGVSGGIWGLDLGYGLMVGGDAETVEKSMPIFDALRPEGPRDEGFVHAGDVGAGHYTKMVHNGIEYGLMHAYAEGYEVLEAKDIVKDVHGCFKAWTRGTVVRSWLLDLLVKALEEEPHLAQDVSEYTTDSGEGRWTLEEGIDLAVPMPVLAAALFARFASRQENSPSMAAVAALRGQFGGHEVMEKGDEPWRHSSDTRHHEVSPAALSKRDTGRRPGAKAR